MKKLLFFVSISFVVFSCVNNRLKKEEIAPVSVDEPRISYAKDIQPIIVNNCIECHFAGSTIAPHDWTNASEFQEYALKPSSVNSYTFVQSRIKGIITPRMPIDKDPLPDSLIRKIDIWISQGASIE